MMTIEIFYHLSGFKCFKYYYNRFVLPHLKSYFPNLVSYNRFVELKPRMFLYLWVFLNAQRSYNKEKSDDKFYMDSKKLTVCHNRRIHQHKVFKGLATRGKSSVGWFFGFKLFLVTTAVGQVARCFITPANVADNSFKAMDKLLAGLKGTIYGDKGFISSKAMTHFLEKGLKIITKIRTNMKNKLISLEDKFYLMKRGVIESVFDIMSAICDIDHTRHRSPKNAFVNLFGGIIAYTYLDKLPSIFSKKIN